MLFLVLLVLALARLAFAAAHASIYLHLARRFWRIAKTGLPRFGATAALVAVALPLFGVAWALQAAITTWRSTPPEGWRGSSRFPCS